MTLSIRSITSPRELVLHAEQALVTASPTEYVAIRRSFVSEATVLFGSDDAQEVGDALPDDHSSYRAIHAEASAQ